MSQELLAQKLVFPIDVTTGVLPAPSEFSQKEVREALGSSEREDTCCSEVGTRAGTVSKAHRAVPSQACRLVMGKT